MHFGISLTSIQSFNLRYNLTKLSCLVLLASIIFFTACNDSDKNSKPEYEDYDPEDFYEVTARVIENRPGYHFPKTNVVHYEYFLDRETPLRGWEENLKLQLKKGDKFMVLVHKQDSTLSFFGYVDPMFRKGSFEKSKRKANQSFE